MVNNYPEYAADISYQKAEEGEKHFYNAQVKVDPSDDSMSAVLTKDGTVISELPDGGGGGGGSSDFTTAKVNFIVEESITEDFLINIINVYGNDMFDSLDSADIGPEGVDAVLYKGGAKVNVLQTTGVKIKEVSGAATMLDYLHAKITGNCSITFTIAST